MTPALIPIYFRGAKRETATYPEELQKQIRFERTVTVVGQLAILASIVVFAGWWIAFKVYLVPILFVFPVAFTLNRLGQHYNINPDDPAQWSSLMKPSRFWDTAFLWSNLALLLTICSRRIRISKSCSRLRLDRARLSVSRVQVGK